MILCVGEILADMIGTDTEQGKAYVRKAGGAPFNVACAAKKLGADTAFYGSVGDDVIGRFLIKTARSLGLGGEISKLGSACTTLAFTELDENGERSFGFYRNGTADILMPFISDDVLRGADTVHVGSLMLSQKIGKDYACDIISRAKALGKTVSFDVNFRSDIFTDTNSAVEIFKSVAELVDIIKFSEDEVSIFTDRYICEMLSEKLVCISLGASGSEWRYCGRRGKVGTVKVDQIDTTGAGDVFFAGVLTKLDGKNIKDLTDDMISDALRFGNICGALNTMSYGAVDGSPDKETAERMFDRVGKSAEL